MMTIRATLSRNGHTNNDGTRTVVIEIYSRATKERTTMTTGIRVNDNDFLYGRVLDSHPDHDLLNSKVRRLIRRLMEHEDDMERKGITPTPRSLKDAITKNISSSATLKDFTMSVVESDSSRCLNTKRAYRYMVADIEKEFGEVRVSDVTYDLVIRWREIQRKKGLSENTIKGRLKALRCIMEQARLRDVILKNPFDRIQIGNIGARVAFLTPAEIKRLERLELKGRDRRIRDMFLLSCVTGLRFGDIITLHEAEIRNGMLRKTMNKTHHEILLPVDRLFYGKAMEIINAYPDIRQLYKRISNTTVNRTLKELAKKARIKKRVYFHEARKSFCQMLSDMGMPLPDISLLMGHLDTRTTRNHYLANESKRITKSVNKIFKDR